MNDFQEGGIDQLCAEDKQEEQNNERSGKTTLDWSAFNKGKGEVGDSEVQRTFGGNNKIPWLISPALLLYEINCCV